MFGNTEKLLKRTKSRFVSFCCWFVYILPETISRLEIWFRFARSMFTFPRFCILPLKPRMPFYAVAKGRSPGIYKTWWVMWINLLSPSINEFHLRDDCKAQIEKFSGAAFKKFNTEAECNRFISERAAGSSTNTEGVQKPTIISNAVAQKALHTTPSGNKFTGGSRQGQRPTKFTAPQRQQPTRDSHSSATDDDVDVKFLANLGNCLKRRSTADQDTRKTKQGRYEFQTDKLGFVHVYTDGSCVNNGKVGARAGLGVYFGEDHPL